MTVEAVILLTNKRGLHARAAAKLVKCAESFTSATKVSKVPQHNGEESPSVSARSILGLMMLGAEVGSSLHIWAEGEDEEAALAAVKALVEDKFGEGE